MSYDLVQGHYKSLYLALFNRCAWDDDSFSENKNKNFPPK